MPLVAITCPVSKTKDYIFDNWLWHTANNLAVPPSWDVVYYFSDNSNDGGAWLAQKQAKWEALLPGQTFWGRIHEADIHKCLNRPVPNTRELLMHSHNQCRDFTLATGAGYMLHVECDVLAPANSLLKLDIHARTGKKVVSGAYFTGAKESPYLIVHVSREQGNHRFTYPLGASVDDMMFMDGSVKKVHGCGIGFTLIHQNVLEQIKFRYEKEIDAHPDTYFYKDLELMGGQAWLDTSIICNHYNTAWKDVDFTS